MKNKRIESMTISAILIAFIAIMSFVPYLGYIAIPGTPISICTIHIVVILAALLFGWKQGLVAGLTFGLLSCFRAWVMPAAPSDILFRNPLVSVLPRALFGFAAGLTFDYLRRIRNVGVRSVSYVIGCALMTLLHTVLVLTALWIFNRNEFGDGFLLIMTTLISINGLIEILSASILAPSLAAGIGSVKKNYNPYSLTPYKEKITIEPFLFGGILLLEIFAITGSGNLLGLVPLCLTVVHIVIRIIVRKN